MRILLLGKIGQLGWELCRTLAPLGEVTAVDYPEIDLSKPESIRPIIEQAAPQIIVNATAYTAVDRAESEPQLAEAINATAPGVLAEIAKNMGAALIHYSTDYVFDGAKGSDYIESDHPHPLGIYGKTKLGGEQTIEQVGGAFLILRTSWVYSLRRPSFATKVLQWSRQQPTLRIVSDQIGNPTWARMLAQITALLLAKAGRNPAVWLAERSGLYHLAGNGRASRLEWAKAVLALDPHKEDQVAQEILPARTADFPTTAQRPLHSALNCDLFQKTFGLQLPAWQDALRMAMEQGV